MGIWQPKIQTYIRDTFGAETTSLPSPQRSYPSSTVLRAMRIPMPEQPMTHPQLTSWITARHCSYSALTRLPLGTPGIPVTVELNPLLLSWVKRKIPHFIDVETSSSCVWVNKKQHAPEIPLMSRFFLSCRKIVLSKNDVRMLQDELKLCALILSYSPKNESTWSHRYTLAHTCQSLRFCFQWYNYPHLTCWQRCPKYDKLFHRCNLTLR